MTLITSLGLMWYLQGNPIQIEFTRQALLPDLHNANLWVSLTGIVLSFCGIEIATVHAQDVKNPQSAFPKALFWAVIIILSTLMFGSLAIAAVIPSNEMSLVAGIMQAFDTFFSAYHMHWVLPIIAVMLIIGTLGSVSNWILAPTQGLMVAAKDGHLPSIFQKQNRHGAPVNLLIYQACIVTALTTLFLFMPSINSSYWLLTVLAAQLYMFMYLLMFAAGIYLRYKCPDQPRPFKIPGGKFGMWLVAGMGMIGCITTIVVGFIPPTDIQMGTLAQYDALIVGGLLMMSLPPFFTFRRKLIASSA